ncbi:CO/xanthine dehydrogenase Mo-binding subunit [Rhodoligotrophos appendicifer]|uniref:xanthine dehydrogenase family protein molybdopterin-binding subunit n=1 Tax=Rhodoligotrophos appendicifer TaxID=987056 RepID=UPI001478B865|nr:molybdopterin cofactor-binding domain-containing protein [Rhodoligotrophos appendicifer]
MADHTDINASLAAYPHVDDWVRFREDGRLTIRTGKVDIGQRISTALALIAAEEFDVGYDRIDIESVDTDVSLDEEYTSASNSIERSGQSIRLAVATARRHLMTLASTALGAEISKLEVTDGLVKSRDSNYTVSYWDLIQADGFNIPVDKEISTKRPEDYKLIGRKKVVPKSLPDLISGKALFVQDLSMPDMLHARVIRPPHYHARLEGLTGLSEAEDAVLVQDGSFLAVASSDEYRTIRLAEKIRAGTRWTCEKPMDDSNIYQQLICNRRESLPVSSEGATFDPVQPLQDPPLSAVATIEARIMRPYLMHGSIGPSAAMALYKDERLTIWTHSQGVFPLKMTLAEVLNLDPQALRLIQMRGPGTYGHNGADDAALDAALVALAVPGRPILLKWTRSDEHCWEPYGPAMVVDIRASLDADGMIVDWSHETYSGTHRTRPRPGPDKAGPRRMLATHHLSTPVAPFVPEPALSGPMAGIHRGAFPYYDVPSPRVVKHLVHDLPLRTSTLRTLGSFTNVFAIETMMDRLAEAAGKDPIDFRLSHLRDERAKSVIRAAADTANWPGSNEDSHGRGFAFARYNNRKAYAAVIADIVLGDDADLRFKRITIAVDAGEIIDHDGLRLQIEGGVLQAASWMRYEEVHYDQDGIASRDWETYPILRCDNIPHIEVVLLDRPGKRYLGPSECSLSPTGAAIANAVYNATGLRLSRMPFTPESIRSAAMDT